MSKSTEIKRGGFIGMIAAACAAPALAGAKPGAGPVKRLVVFYDLNLIAHTQAHEFGMALAEMGLQGPIVGLDFNCQGDPIRIVNIDEIPPETVDSLIAKFSESAIDPPRRVSDYQYFQFAGVAPHNGNYATAQAFWKGTGNDNA